MPTCSDGITNVRTSTSLMSSPDSNDQVRSTVEFIGGNRQLDPNMDGVSVGPIVDKRRSNGITEYLVSLNFRTQEEKQWMTRKNFPQIDWGELIEQFVDRGYEPSKNNIIMEPTCSNEPVYGPNNSARKEGSGHSGKVISVDKGFIE